MRYYSIIFFVTFFINLNATNLKLVINKTNTKDFFEIELKVHNEGTETVNILNSNDGSFWTWTYPCISFIAETQINGNWKKIRETKATRCGNYSNWYETKKIISIQPNEIISVGVFTFRKGLESWFSLIEDNKIRFSAIYQIGGFNYNDTKLDELKIEKTYLKSNSIIIDYIFDKKSSFVNSQLKECFRLYARDKKITDVFNSYVVIDKPKNETETIHLGLKKLHINPSNIKIIGLFFANEDKTFPKVIVFKMKGDLYLAFSTQLHKKMKDDLSEKYIFNLLKANDFIYH